MGWEMAIFYRPVEVGRPLNNDPHCINCDYRHSQR